MRIKRAQPQTDNYLVVLVSQLLKDVIATFPPGGELDFNPAPGNVRILL